MPQTPDASAKQNKKLAVPDEAALKQSLAMIRKTHKDGYRASDKAAFAEKLLQEANESKGDTTAQFALLQEAKKLAAEASQGELVFEVIDAMASEYDVNGSQLKAEVLEQAAKKARLTPDQRTAIAEAALQVIDDAIAEDNLDTAKRVGKLAIQLARPTKDKDLIQDVLAKNKDVEALANAFADVQEAMATVKQNPNDPEANLAVGKYLCFTKSDWKKGVPMLALGNDSKLKNVATQDLKEAASSTEQVKLGDNWWSYAEIQKGILQKRVQGRAAYWYRQALPGLTGMVKDEVKKRLKESESLEAQSATKFRLAIVKATALPSETSSAAFRRRGKATATSVYSDQYKPEYAMDGKPDTYFSFAGHTGEITFDWGRGVRCSMVVFQPKSDMMEVGKISVNGGEKVSFANFGGDNWLVVRPTGVVRTITIESFKSTMIPGITETYFVQ